MIFTFNQIEKILGIVESKNSDVINMYKAEILALKEQLKMERLRADMAIDQLLNKYGSGTVMPQKTNLPRASSEPITFDKFFNGDTFGEMNKVGEDDGAEDKTTKEEIV